MFRSHRFGIVLLAVGLAVFAAGCGDDDDDNPVNPPPTLELNSPTLSNGGVYTHTFANAGTFPYHCHIHPAMTGSITVDPNSAVTTLSIGITDNAFTPSTTTVKTGAVVTWTNNGSNPHTVTSD